MAYLRSMRSTLQPVVRPPMLPRFPQGTSIGGSPTLVTTPRTMPQAPNTTTPRVAAICTPSSTNDENASIWGTTFLRAQTQSSSRVNWRLQEVMVLVKAKKDLDVRQEEGGIYIQSRDRWHTIAEACRSRGVHRSKS
ncbi:hypothetical protein L7F22_065771 [Adiantum nelumboides]|nr:hypothetical protein [Adiantum nelumboides]